MRPLVAAKLTLLFPSRTAPPSTWITKHKSHDFGFSLPIHWGVDSCGCSCGCGAGDVGITTARTTTTARATTTSIKPVTTSVSTSKATTTSKKPATTSSSKAASTTSKKPTTSTSHKPAATTSSKPAASTTTKKPSTPTSKPVTTTQAGTTKTMTCASRFDLFFVSAHGPLLTLARPLADIGDTSTVTIPGDIVTVTRTISISQPKPTGTPSYGWKCDGSGKDGYEVRSLLLPLARLSPSTTRADDPLFFVRRSTGRVTAGPRTCPRGGRGSACASLSSSPPRSL